jgi:Sulfotransferase domain
MDVLTIPYQFLTSLWHTTRKRHLFDDVKAYVLFIGYPRSGHSLVGFLLDAHPDVVVASQTSAHRYFRHGFSARQTFYCILENSRKVARIGRGWRPYSYDVPNQWQGRFARIQVIGESTGLTRLRRNPSLLKVFREKLNPVELKLIHVIRNPYDNISTMKKRSQETLPESIERYFSMCEVVEQIKRLGPPGVVCDLKHETLIADPRSVLQYLCTFLGLSAEASYYDDYASIIYKSPHKTRNDGGWNQKLIDSVQQRMRPFSFLDGYSYHDE